MTPEARRQLVEEILWEAQKGRSNIHEIIGWDDVGKRVVAELEPRLSDSNPLNLVDVCLRVLDGDREVQPGDLYNVLYLAHQSPVVEFGFAFREKELPKPLAAFEGLYE